MTTKRNKRGVPRTLQTLIEELSRLQSQLAGARPEASKLVVATIVRKFPWDVLDQRRREQGNKALADAAILLEMLLRKVSTRRRQPKAERFREVRQQLQVLASHREFDECLQDVASSLSHAALHASSDQAARRRPSAIQFLGTLREQLLESSEVVRDLAEGGGPAHAAYGVLARSCGLSLTTVKEAVAGR
ncbi:MAG: hypothetical protein Q8S42_37085 [Archangium sp.]|nr:hypothetical protein [Archangium sp.]